MNGSEMNYKEVEGIDENGKPTTFKIEIPSNENKMTLNEAITICRELKDNPIIKKYLTALNIVVAEANRVLMNEYSIEEVKKMFDIKEEEQ